MLERGSISVGAEGFSLAFTNLARGLCSLWKMFDLQGEEAGELD